MTSAPRSGTSLVIVIATIAAACAKAPPHPPPAPPTRAEIPPAATPAPPPAADDWHDRHPAPVKGTRGKLPFYPVVIGYYKCALSKVGSETFVACGDDVARATADGLDVTTIRSAPRRDGEIATGVFGTWPKDVWVSTEPGPPALYAPPVTDFFAVYRGGYLVRRAGAWTHVPSAEGRKAYRGGWLVFDLPRLEKPVDTSAPGCADYACGRLVPKFWGIGVTAPDLSSLEGKIAWLNRSKEIDWDYAVDEAGPIYVLLRALDLRSGRRTFGVIRHDGDEARFEPIAGLDPDAVVFAEPGAAEARAGRARFRLTTTRGTKTLVHQLEWSGKKWTLTSTPPKPPEPSSDEPLYGDGREDGPEIQGYRMSYQAMLQWKDEESGEFITLDSPLQGGELHDRGPGDVWSTNNGLFYRTKRPRETLRLAATWGGLVPWPAEAEASCSRPFAVVDALDPEEYRNIRAAAQEKKAGKWGALPRGFESIALVETKVNGLVVIGAVMPDVEKAKALVQATSDWAQTTTGESVRLLSGVVCARPVDPRPFRIEP